MKIIKLFGFMVLGVAVGAMAACDAGEIKVDNFSSTAGLETDGEDYVLPGGDGETDVFESTSDPGLCPGDYILPAGEQAYFQIRPNEFFNWRFPLIENYLYDQLMSHDPGDEGAQRYSDYAYGGQQSNLRAMAGVVFDDEWRDLFGFGVGDVQCVVGAYGSRSQTFCSGDGEIEPSCFDTIPNIMDEINSQIPIIGTLIQTAYNYMPDTYRSILSNLPIPVLSPAPVMYEFLTDMEMKIVIDGVPEGFIAEFRDFIEYAWPLLMEMAAGPAKSISLLPGMTPLPAEAVAPSFAPLEEIDGCWLGTFQVSTLVRPAVVVGGDSENFSIIACERSVGEDNFLILATPASIDGVLDMVDSRNAGYEPASLADDACYKQTYKALWDESMATPLPFLRTCANLDEMQSTLLGRIDGLVDNFGGREFNLGVDFALVKPLKASGPIESFMLPANRSAEMFRLGLSTTLSYKTDVAASLQLYESTQQDLPAYDLRFRFGLDTSSSFTDGIASDLIFGQEITEGTDLYDIGAQMILMVEQLMEGYTESQL